MTNGSPTTHKAAEYTIVGGIQRRANRDLNHRAAVVRRGSTAEQIGLVLIAGDRVLPPRVADVGGVVQPFHFACTSRPLVFS